jgi:hypothetical protein
VDPDAARRERTTVPYLAERRPDLYRSWDA